MISNQKAQFIKQRREIAASNDSPELQAKRSKFLDFLAADNWQPSIQVLEMYPCENDEPVKSKSEIYNYFNRWHNTRTKSPAETCCEIDKLDFLRAYFILHETILALIRKQIHFAVWYAQGQRSLHIRIYDFEELRELTPFQRVKAQISFWRSVVPFGCFQYVDTGLFDDDHFMCLEFAPHWKYGTPFNLVLEWLPEQQEIKCST